MPANHHQAPGAVAMVTGASRGIGRGIAIELAKHGFDIAGCATRLDPDNRHKGLFEVKDRVEALGRQFVPIAGDIANSTDHARMVAEVIEAFGAIDVLVNNAGVAPTVRLDILDTNEESFERLININTRGPFFLTQRVAKHMMGQNKDERPVAPCIIFITSISSNMPSQNRTEYCISKAALSMAALSYAVRLAGEGINVYDVRPGITETDMTGPVKEKYDRIIGETDLLLTRRWGQPEDVGKACAALALGYFPYSTGSVIEVGGGIGVQKL